MGLYGPHVAGMAYSTTRNGIGGPSSRTGVEAEASSSAPAKRMRIRIKDSRCWNSLRDRHPEFLGKRDDKAKISVYAKAVGCAS